MNAKLKEEYSEYPHKPEKTPICAFITGRTKILKGIELETIHATA
jgi:hypothetical protein